MGDVVKPGEIEVQCARCEWQGVWPRGVVGAMASSKAWKEHRREHEIDVELQMAADGLRDGVLYGPGERGWVPAVKVQGWRAPQPRVTRPNIVIDDIAEPSRSTRSAPRPRKTTAEALADARKALGDALDQQQQQQQQQQQR